MKMRTRMYAFLTLILAFQSMDSLRSIADDTKGIENVKVNLTTCECPAVDPIGNLGCAPLPVQATSNLFPDTSCPAIWDALSVSLRVITQTADSMYSTTNLKTPAQSLDYMSCYAERAYDKSKLDKVPPKNLFCHFKTTLAPQIALAAKSGGLPFAVQACMFFRESMFDSNAKSAKGATGYVQFMPDTIKHMSDIAGVTAEFYEKKIADNESLKAEAQAKLGTKVSTPTQILLQKQINRYDAENAISKANLAAKKVWDRYWAGTPTGDIKIGPQSVKCPQVAFALSVMKQTYDLNLLTTNFGSKFDASRTDQETLSINQMDERDSAILLAGAYNAGAAGLAKRCGSEMTFEQCASKLPAETRNYVKSIRACATKDSAEAMTHFTQKNCEDFKCKK